MRVFLTSSFRRAAHRHRVAGAELCQAARYVLSGRAANLGGGVFKRRLRENRLRGIVVVSRAQYCYFVYLYDKQDQSGLDAAELRQFRELAKGYESLSARQLADLLYANALKEVRCDSPQVQESGP